MYISMEINTPSPIGGGFSLWWIRSICGWTSIYAPVEHLHQTVKVNWIRECQLWAHLIFKFTKGSIYNLHQQRCRTFQKGTSSGLKEALKQLLGNIKSKSQQKKCLLCPVHRKRGTECSVLHEHLAGLQASNYDEDDMDSFWRSKTENHGNLPLLSLLFHCFLPGGIHDSRNFSPQESQAWGFHVKF